MTQPPNQHAGAPLPNGPHPHGQPSAGQPPFGQPPVPRQGAPAGPPPGWQPAWQQSAPEPRTGRPADQRAPFAQPQQWGPPTQNAPVNTEIPAPPSITGSQPRRTPDAGHPWQPGEDLGQHTLAPRKTDRPAVARLKPWIFCLAMVLLGVGGSVGYGLWVKQRTGINAKVVPAGTVVDFEGVQYKVLKKETMDKISLGYGDPKKPGKGMTYVVYTVHVKRADMSKEESCTLELIGVNQQKWVRPPMVQPEGTKGHCLTSAMPKGEGDMVVVFEVPTHKLPDVLGVQPFHIMMVDQPPIMQAP